MRQLLPSQTVPAPHLPRDKSHSGTIPSTAISEQCRCFPKLRPTPPPLTPCSHIRTATAVSVIRARTPVTNKAWCPRPRRVALKAILPTMGLTMLIRRTSLKITLLPAVFQAQDAVHRWLDVGQTTLHSTPRCEAVVVCRRCRQTAQPTRTHKYHIPLCHMLFGRQHHGHLVASGRTLPVSIPLFPRSHRLERHLHVLR